MGKDKWAKVISYLRSSNRDPDKVLKLLKGNQKGKETNYDINRSSYALNIIAVITQKMADPKNKGKTRAHIIRTWVKSDDFKSFYNLMRHEENLKWSRDSVEKYVKQINVFGWDSVTPESLVRLYECEICGKMKQEEI